MLHMDPFSSAIPYHLPLLPPAADFRVPELYEILPDVRAALGELKGYAELLPNPLLLLSPAIIKESLASSEIENIHTTLEDVLQQNIFPETEQRPENKEVLRYREAILLGYEEMQRLPLSRRMIEGIQNKLMPGKYAGFRTVQNRIANQNTGEVLYTPPSAENLGDLISNLESFYHNEEIVLDPLIKTAISHYQFEAIHPFLDGNGRTGRILIVLELIHRKVLNLPVLYISGYINEHRDEYYRLLRKVSTEGDWIGFAGFMLRVFHTQADVTRGVLFQILKMYNEMREDLKLNHPAPAKTGIADALFAMPIVTPVRLAQELGIHYTTASRYLTELRDAGKLEYLEAGKYHLFINRKLMDVLNK